MARTARARDLDQRAGALRPRRRARGRRRPAAGRGRERLRRPRSMARGARAATSGSHDRRARLRRPSTRATRARRVGRLQAGRKRPSASRSKGAPSAASPRDAAGAASRRRSARRPDRPGPRRRRWCRRRAAPDRRRRRAPRPCRPAPRPRRRLRPSGAREQRSRAAAPGGSAAIRPARPPPTMIGDRRRSPSGDQITHVHVVAAFIGRIGQHRASTRCTARRARRSPGSTVTSCGIVSQRLADVLQRDPLHVRAEIAGPHELGVGMLRRRRCRPSSIR